ncbi:tRNA lysidine(34) synthetase TilS [Reichenbachiella versicolor]|uniref:tRNA lysidine(34) synthetase TilS n=1 Tax=Reichenbachiella versicolor TaxID=1821036 RepID=UPI0013A52E24|nr:tRNA lysidine(34) synthetase TilS [Reichenbachiella versicolor]
MFQKQDKLLLAVSGGLDSVVLSKILRQLDFQIHLAHCNFGLRGKDSNEDEALVKEISIKLNTPFSSKRFKTEQYASNNKVSIQMAARELRYKWFDEIIEQFNLDYLITAHHAGDQTETTLFNWTKGTSIKGMRGILPKAGKIVRPLIFATKSQILEYAKENNIEWREDQSNKSNKYHRNKLRNEIIPRLKEINPNIHQTIGINVERFRSMDELIESEIKLIKKTHLYKYEKSIELRLHWLRGKKGGLILLERIIGEYGFNFEQSKSIISAFESTSGQTYNSTEYILTLDRESLYIEKHSSDYEEKLIQPETTKTEVLGQLFEIEAVNKRMKINPDPNYAILDADLLNFPIKARQKCDGDKFIPLGMKNQKKVSDFMIDEKIPVNLKKRTVIFESKDEIIWIAGHRISDKFKITSKTQRCLIIKRLQND